MPLQWRNKLRQSLEDLGRMPESEAWRVVLLSRADVAPSAHQGGQLQDGNYCPSRTALSEMEPVSTRVLFVPEVKGENALCICGKTFQQRVMLRTDI